MQPMEVFGAKHRDQVATATGLGVMLLPEAHVGFSAWHHRHLDDPRVPLNFILVHALKAI